MSLPDDIFAPYSASLDLLPVLRVVSAAHRTRGQIG